MPLKYWVQSLMISLPAELTLCCGYWKAQTYQLSRLFFVLFLLLFFAVEDIRTHFWSLVNAVSKFISRRGGSFDPLLDPPLLLYIHVHVIPHRKYGQIIVVIMISVLDVILRCLLEATSTDISPVLSLLL